MPYIYIYIYLLRSVNGTIYMKFQGNTHTHTDSNSIQVQWSDSSPSGKHSLGIPKRLTCPDSTVLSVSLGPLPQGGGITYTGDDGLFLFFSNIQDSVSQSAWNFGDNDSCGCINPAHQYQDTGRYDVISL